MASAVRKLTAHLSEADYLALEQYTGIRHEMIDGEAYAMAGGTLNHARLINQISAALTRHLAGQKCESFAENVKVKLPSNHGQAWYFYPDVVVDCSVEHAENNMLTTPVLIIEVLSASTHKQDETTKFQAYKKISTLQEYVLVDQNKVKIEVHRRSNGWLNEKFFLGESVTFASIGLTLLIEDLYARVDNEEINAWREQQKQQEQKPA